jgi:hypothetical protein
MSALLAAVWSGVALADEGELVLGGRAIAEVWQDTNLATVYRSTGLGISGAFSWRPLDLLSLDGGVGVLRMTGEANQAIQLMPLSLDVCARAEREEMELFFGLGPALVPFVDEGVSVITGTKLGLDVQAGARFATDLINPSLSSTSPVQRADWEVTIGRRQHFGSADAARLDLSAWRLGVGMVVRL